MPRLARLDVVGVLQHVMVRGIEKRDIFIDDLDRRRFLRHFSELLIKTETACMAWCLMPNHFHLLLRSQKTKLSFFMRRLLTSYAVGFNLRHDRVGHLFQNRYKSLVCEEEPYLLELIRYIHLNPVRAGIISDAGELQSYLWSGHAVLMGKAELAGQVTSEVLSRFGNNPLKARGKYLAFVMEAADAGHRDRFGTEGGILGSYLVRGKPGEESGDSRVLGSGDFVEQLWGEQEQEIPEFSISFPVLLQEVAAAFDVEVSSLRHANKSHGTSQARAALCYLAMREFGYSGVALARALGITPAGVTLAAGRGEKIVKEEKYQGLLLRIRNLKS